MSEIERILLIPAEGDPHGLLKEGPCGARPPTAWFARCKGVLVPAPHAAARRCGHCDRPLAECQQRALVLAWDGKPVPEGCFRADTTEWHLFVELITSILAGELRAWSDMPKTNVDALADLVPGALVLLDADGREVSDE